MALKRGEHKGENGRVLVVGGSEDYVGAPALSALAALAVLRSGADLVTVSAPEKVAWVINTYSPDLITKKLRGKVWKKEHIKDISKIKFDVVLIGPGMGQSDGAKKLVDELIKINKPKVLDADALKIVDYRKLRNCVVTPHEKEFEILFGEKATKEGVKRFGKEDLVVLLKGGVDLISDGKQLMENKTGNNSMTKGGTGDVLAGLVAGYIAQGMSLYEAACKAAYVNGAAGEALHQTMGYGYLASDLLEVIPMVG